MTGTDLFGRPVRSVAEFKARISTSAGRTRLTSDITTKIEQGDCLDVLKRLADKGAQYDSCITDPPYHLVSTVSRFRKTNTKGKSKAEISANDRSTSYGRLSKGFMGQEWDGGNISYQPETWKAVSSVLRPGAFVCVFSGTRTFHRVWCAIEDSGLVLQDTVLWLYSTGFPKRRDSFKPAWEPIAVAYKPGGNRTFHADECSVGVGVRHNARANDKPGTLFSTLNASDSFPGTDVIGRWPANVCHDGSEKVMEAFAEYGDYSSSPWADMSKHSRRQMSIFKFTGGSGGFSDTGSISRYFYCAKADDSDRVGSDHPTVKPIALMRWLIRLFTPEGGTVVDPFAGTGSTGAAALMEGIDSVLIERDNTYIADMHRKIDIFRNRRSRTLY